mmetsp:Transcript_29903/g.75307  ORF Transcript_29903/g.75307 Transcript_29903/m.75307 type:complete len:221 (-) Transcript_29903:380-1042(-)
MSGNLDSMSPATAPTRCGDRFGLCGFHDSLLSTGRDTWEAADGILEEGGNIIDFAWELSTEGLARLTVASLAVDVHSLLQGQRGLAPCGLENMCHSVLGRFEHAFASCLLAYQLRRQVENEVEGLWSSHEDCRTSTVTVGLSDSGHEWEQWPWIQVVRGEAMTINNYVELLGTVAHTAHTCFKDSSVVLGNVLQVCRENVPETSVKDWVAASSPGQNSEV